MIQQDIKPLDGRRFWLGFVRCKKRQERKIDQRFCMVCEEKCEEKSNLDGIRFAKNDRMVKLLRGGRNGNQKRLKSY
jgi:hypothetical protein